MSKRYTCLLMVLFSFSVTVLASSGIKDFFDTRQQLPPNRFLKIAVNVFFDYIDSLREIVDGAVEEYFNTGNDQFGYDDFDDDINQDAAPEDHP